MNPVVVSQTYTLTVEARDGGGLTDTVTLTLTLTDVNDHTPQFTVNTYTTTLNENVNIGYTVFTVAATDNDSGVNGQVTYTITGLFFFFLFHNSLMQYHDTIQDIMMCFIFERGSKCWHYREEWF